MALTITDVARMAYGSRCTEGTSGGRGHIGLLNGRVVKFDTHGEKVGADLKQESENACNALRTALWGLSENMLTKGDSKQAEALKKISEALGVGNNGATEKGLLSRKVVAKVINIIEKTTGKTIWAEMKRDNGAVNSRNIPDMSFKAVKEGTEKLWGDFANDTSETLGGRIMAMCQHIGSLPKPNGNFFHQQSLGAMQDLLALLEKNSSKQDAATLDVEIESLTMIKDHFGDGAHELRDSFERLINLVDQMKTLTPRRNYDAEVPKGPEAIVEQPPKADVEVPKEPSPEELYEAELEAFKKAHGDVLSLMKPDGVFAPKDIDLQADANERAHNTFCRCLPELVREVDKSVRAHASWLRAHGRLGIAQALVRSAAELYEGVTKCSTMRDAEKQMETRLVEFIATNEHELVHDSVLAYLQAKGVENAASVIPTGNKWACKFGGRSILYARASLSPDDDSPYSNTWDLAKALNKAGNLAPSDLELDHDLARHLIDDGVPLSYFCRRDEKTCLDLLNKNRPKELPRGAQLALLEKVGVQADDGYANDVLIMEMTRQMTSGNWDGLDATQLRTEVDAIIAKTQVVLPEEYKVLATKTDTSPVTFEQVSPQDDDHQVHGLVADLLCPEHLETLHDKGKGYEFSHGRRLHALVSQNAQTFVNLLNEVKAQWESDHKEGRQTVSAFANMFCDESEANEEGDDDDVKHSKAMAGLLAKTASGKTLDAAGRSVLATVLARLMILVTPNDPNYSKDKFKSELRLGEDKFSTMDAEGKELFSGMEVAIGTCAKSVCAQISEEFEGEKLDKLFGAEKPSDFNYKAGSLDKVLATGPDHDLEFLKSAMKEYFKGLGEIDARILLANRTRNFFVTSKTSQDAEIAAVLKSSGPILVKMLQGLDTSRVGERMRAILADLKDSLYEIPQVQVRAFLEDMVQKSNGKITSVTVKKSLGAASVGQAFLCEVKTQNSEKTVQTAIKVLRPEAGLRARRERQLLDRIAEKLDNAQRATFAGKVESIMQEFNFCNEATNIRDGGDVYSSEKTELPNVDSVKLLDSVEPQSHVLGMACVEGCTFKCELDDMAKRIGQTEDLPALKEIRDELVRNHKALESVAKLWIEKAIFTEGGGFYHGDLHSGNIMVDPKTGKATLIDFGNVTKLTDEQCKAFLHVIAGAAAGVSGATCGLVAGFWTLLTKESQVKLDARIYKEDPRKQQEDATYVTLEQKINHLLAQGTGNDVGKRVAAVLKLLRCEGFEVPPAIHNFNESQMRLSEVLSTSSQLLDVLDAKIVKKGGAPGKVELKSLISCVADVVRDKSEFTINRLGWLNGYTLAKGFYENDIITKEALDDVLKGGGSELGEAISRKLAALLDLLKS